MTIALEYQEGIDALRASAGPASAAAAIEPIMVRRSNFMNCPPSPETRLTAFASCPKPIHLRIIGSDGYRSRPHHDARANERRFGRCASSQEPRRVHRPAGGA